MKLLLMRLLIIGCVGWAAGGVAVDNVENYTEKLATRSNIE